jgi:hypothetical protein
VSDIDVCHFHNSLPPTGSFDGPVHLSEEATNAAIAVPWAIVGSIAVAAVLGLGQCCPTLTKNALILSLAVNISLAFCMGSDITAIASSPQPMAQIILNSLGQKGALILWLLVVLAQYVFPPPPPLHRCGFNFNFNFEVHDGFHLGKYYEFD